VLISKDEELKTSYPHVGYLILRHLRRDPDRKSSIYQVAERLRNDGIKHTRQVILGLLFLHATGLIEFNAPFVELVDAKAR
jgi:hypothetical protein